MKLREISNRLPMRSLPKPLSFISQSEQEVAKLRAIHFEGDSNSSVPILTSEVEADEYGNGKSYMGIDMST